MRSSRSVLRGCLLAGAAPLAVLALAAGPAQAQAPAAPAQPADQPNTVAEIVVTAQFREQNLQKTPLAITAVNSQMLENRNQTRLSDVTAQAPNVTLAPNGAAFGSSMVAFIRGIGQTDFNLALEPGVGIYVDDVYYPTLTGSLLDLLDLDRVEILRGPQGTLAGKNSIGGAIKLYTQKPTGNDGGYIELTYGSLNRLNARGAANFTIVPDKLFARISGSTENHDGYVTRYDYACTHPGSNVKSLVVGDGCTLGHDGDQHVANGRLAIRWVPTDRLEVNVSGSVTQDNSGVQANTLLKVAAAPPTGSGLGWATYTAGVNGAPVFFTSQFLPPNPYSSYATYHSNACSVIFGCDPYAPISVPPINHLYESNADITIDYKLAENLHLKSITGYQYYSNQFAEQTDASPVGVQILLQKQVHHSVSQEVRLTGNWDTRLDYTIGGFFLDQNGGLNARVGLPWVGFDFTHGPDSTPAQTKAAFADATWHVIDKLDLSGGVRYSDETKDYRYLRHNADGTPITNPLAYNGILGPQAGPPPLPALSGTRAHFQGSRLDYRVAAQYQITPDIMAYVDTATGYKGGGVDPRPFVLTQAVSFQPETLTAYEGGLKMFLLDRRMRLNLAGFYNEYNKIQLTLSSCPQQSGGNPAIPCALPANVGNAHVSGFEAETEVHPFPGFEVDGSVSYLNFKYTSIANTAATGISLGMKTPYTPEWKWSIGAQYTIDMGAWGSLTPRIDANYQSSEFTNPINSTDWNQIAAYTVANARITYRAPAGGWTAWLEVSNFTDKLYYLTLFDTHLSAGYLNGQPAMPREWSLTVKKTF
jgi:iron complex outermembrane receptor protein